MRENKVMGIIFSDMHDSALGALTENRTTASVPFGGRYRLIDFTLSNMVNSDISDIGIITKSNYQSLMDHVGAGRPWDLARKRGGLAIIPPFASHGGLGIYRGRLEALAGALSYIRHNDAKYVMISDSDVIANVDLRDMVKQHIASNAQMTLLYKTITVGPDLKGEDLTLMTLDEETGDVKDIARYASAKGQQNLYLNVLLIEKTLLERMINDAMSHDQYSMVRHCIQPAVGRMTVKGYAFEGYATKIENMNSYFAAHMDLLKPEVRTELFPKDRPVFTKVRDQVSVRYGLSSKVGNSLIADGCIINGEVYNSIIFRGAKIGKDAVVRNCIIMQNTYVGDNAHLEYVISDKDVLIKDSRTLVSYETHPIYISKGDTI